MLSRSVPCLIASRPSLAPVRRPGRTAARSIEPTSEVKEPGIELPKMFASSAPFTQAEPAPPVAPRDTTAYPVIGALASLGALETGYLAASKLLNLQVACPTSGCEDVLSSPYAYLLGQPLSIFGFAAYATVAALAFNLNSIREASNRAAASDDSSQSGRPSSSDATTSSSSSSSSTNSLELGLLGGATLLLSTSGYLMYVLFGKLGGESCTYCLTSAALSTTIFVLSFGIFNRKPISTAAPLVAGLAAATLVALNVAHKDVDNSLMTFYPYQKPVVETTSTSRAIEMARKLRDAGAKMYGAFWCSHCFEQKEYFGAEAMADFPYVECYPEGWYRGVELAPDCKAADVKGFPTWVINGKNYEGEKTLDELEALLAKN